MSYSTALRPKLCQSRRSAQALDIDRLDAVDLIVESRELSDIQIKPAQFRQVRAVGDVVDAIQSLTAKARA